jgi:putative PEP-CTERM system histidine kinase
MTFEVVLHVTGAAMCLAVGILAVWRESRSLVQKTFLAGLGLLALEAVVAALAASVGGKDRLVWERARLLIAAFVPAAWLAFALVFARSQPIDFLRRWRAALVLLAVVPVALVLLGRDAVFVAASTIDPGRYVMALGRAGYAVHLTLLLGSVLVLMNLERTLRASTGSMRWFTKYMVLGVGASFAARIYTTSQALLFRTQDSALLAVHSAALVVGGALMVVSLARSRLRAADVYVSHSVLYRSVTALVVGAYLLLAGALAVAVARLGRVQSLPATTFFVFLVLLGLSVLLLSEGLRQRLRGFVARNFRRPRYDYRAEWLAFTRATRTLLDLRALCAAVASRVSDTLHIPSVTFWLREEGGGGLVLGGSTVYSEAEAADWAQRHGHALLAAVEGATGPIDLHAATGAGGGLLRAADTRYAVKLSAGGEDLGALVLGGRPGGEPLSVEDLDLIQTFADQAAANLLGLQLSDRLLRAKEMEAFQSLSAFFVHDLKNLASKLSLTLQNLPAHYDDPEFRRDLLSVITRSVAKINEMCTRLSPLSRTLELKIGPGDLRGVVGSALAGLNGSLKATLVQELEPTPEVPLDPEQIQKVLLNLVLNANDASREGGRIRVATGRADRFAVLSVSDEGCGMSREFMERSLFKPFRTTKDRGLGIGLFHAKKIVEAHQGRIEVESEEGRGTTFRVLLPS